MAQIPHKKIIPSIKSRKDSFCDSCFRVVKVRYLIKYKGQFLCNKCRQKTEGNKIQASLSQTGINLINLENALNKIYVVKTYLRKRNDSSYIQARLSLPSILGNRKVKLILVDDEKSKK